MKTLEKTFALIDALETSGPSALGTLADQTDLPRSTVHHHLSTLEENGYVVNTEGTYRLSLRFLDIGEGVRRDKELFEIARSEIDELADRIGLPVGLFVREQKSAVVLYTCGENPNIPETLYAGQHLPLHATAPGKALLSVRDESLDESQFQTGELRAVTEQTITASTEFATALQKTADRGYAISAEECWNGRCGIAVPFSSENGTSDAAIEVGLTTEQFEEVDREELVSELQRTANVIEIKSDYSQ